MKEIKQRGLTQILKIEQLIKFSIVLPIKIRFLFLADFKYTYDLISERGNDISFNYFLVSIHCAWSS